MRKIELIFGTVATISIAYKFLLGDELNPIFIMSILGLSLFYTYFSFAYFNNIRFKKILKRESYLGISKWRILGTIGLGLGLGLTTLGILWSLMYWPFNTFYPLGIPILLIIGITSIIRFSKTRSEGYLSILKRILIIGGLGIILWITPQETLNGILGIEMNEMAQIK
ncbi:hypothetical protein [Salinimicrobium gaetbulicola]|uniref:Uncharacterized protein n=1 Tax=Salinimicrobium gaetbulicola TaxID=999702 RepID=A0ABW3ICM3_9FLAO